MAIDTSSPRTRRALLGAGVGALAVTAVSALGRPQGAQAANTYVELGVANPSTTNTRVMCSDYPALTGDSGKGFGIHGVSGTNSGVYGESTSGSGVYGTSDSGVGVDGFSDAVSGVRGSSTTGTGVLGISQKDTGVFGRSPGSGIGVRGDSASGRGVYGSSVSGTAMQGSSSRPDSKATSDACRRHCRPTDSRSWRWSTSPRRRGPGRLRRTPRAPC